MDTEQRRRLALAGTRNLRDIGGYRTHDGRRTRWRTLFRSDCLDQLTAVAQAELLSAGVRTIIDLRDNVEVVERPKVFAESVSVSYRRLPLWDEPPPGNALPVLEHGYLRELDERGVALVAIYRALLAPAALPALIHCAAGKDRTGLVVALLLAVAGVETDVIAEDYALSATCLGQEYVEEGRQWLTSRGHSWERYGHLFATPPERMVKTLDHLERRWGGAERYLVQLGLTDNEVRELRDLLTEPGTKTD